MCIYYAFPGSLLAKVALFKKTTSETRAFGNVTYDAFKFRINEANDTTDLSAFHQPFRGALKSIQMYKR